MHTAFEITPEDVEAVLHSYTHRVMNTQGLSYEALSEELINEIDHGRVEKAALKGGCDLDSQTQAAHDEIHAILVEMQVIEF